MITAQEIRALRTKCKMTQQQLADKLGVARITVIRWEAGDKRPSGLARNQLARLQNQRK